ncbi:hypothetical protein DNI29_04475 [Hymenobacter sediminis]|uniref:hypothetical protein n=1 Tax=Hymenobacter sediminis TaxID=2218621 RepID=UPI000DA6B566|nr:hypothetical protein [Hymenobacter sediminis]RPD50058.1 hypothetical protein DNI29_04475 [Hymenobacter sediminis]
MFPPDPHLFDQHLQQKLLLECEQALGADVGEHLAEVEDILTQMLRPVDSTEAALGSESSFERVCIQLEEKGVQRPGELSLYAFYARVQYQSQKKSPA